MADSMLATLREGLGSLARWRIRKVSTQKPARAEEKEREDIYFLEQKCCRFGCGGRIKMCLIKETQAYLFYLVHKNQNRKIFMNFSPLLSNKKGGEGSIREG